MSSIFLFYIFLYVFNHFPSNPRLFLVQGCVNHDYTADGTIVKINLNVRWLIVIVMFVCSQCINVQALLSLFDNGSEFQRGVTL